MKQKGSIELIVIFILILAIAAGGAYYFGTQKGKGSFIDQFGMPIFNPSEDKKEDSSKTLGKDETANWEIYTNTGYEFLIKHPSFWENNGCKTDDMVVKLLVCFVRRKDNPSPPEGEGIISIEVVKMQFEELKNKQLQLFMNGEVESEERMTVASKSAVKLSGISKEDFVSAGTPREIILINNGNFIYTLHWSSADVSQKKEFEQMISTFKFTN